MHPPSSGRWVSRAGQRVEGQLARRDAGAGWRASYALANFYKDGSESVAAHSGRALPPAVAHSDDLQALDDALQPKSLDLKKR